MKIVYEKQELSKKPIFFGDETPEEIKEKFKFITDETHQIESKPFRYPILDIKTNMIREKNREELILIDNKIELLLEGEHIYYKKIKMVEKPIDVFYPKWDFATHKWIEEYTIEELKIAKLNLISLKRKSAEEESYFFNGEELDADYNSQDKLTKAFLFPNGKTFYNWKNKKNKFIKITLEEMESIINSIKDRTENLFEKEYLISLKIEDAQTIEELSKITWEAN